MKYIKRKGRVYKVTEQEVDVKALENEITNLKQRIESIPKPKTKPDEETLDFYNMNNMDMFEKETLEAEIKDKMVLLKELNSIK